MCAVYLGSGVSPTLPVLFLGAAFPLWSPAESARLRSPAVCAHWMRPSGRSMEQYDERRPGGADAGLGRSSIVRIGSPALPALASIAPCHGWFSACASSCSIPIFRRRVTIEWPWFVRFVSAENPDFVADDHAFAAPVRLPGRRSSSICSIGSSGTVRSTRTKQCRERCSRGGSLLKPAGASWRSRSSCSIGQYHP